MIPSGKAKVAGVLGWPVGHSLSPRLHGFWLEHYRIDGAYIPLPVNPEHLAAVIAAVPRMGLRGASVTVPHKEAVLSLMDDLDPQAQAIGAVNTIVVRADGSLEGRNTDGYGFLENLRQGAPAWHPSRKPAMVIGAGGAARAICVALLDAGVPEIYVVNRTLSRAERLARALSERVIPVAWAAHGDAMAHASLLVNATTLGMTGEPEAHLDLEKLPKDAVVTDIVYAPLETPLLVKAKRRGHVTVDGLGMLIHQARPAFEAWFGVMPDASPELRAFLLAGLGRS